MKRSCRIATALGIFMLVGCSSPASAPSASNAGPATRSGEPVSATSEPGMPPTTATPASPAPAATTAASAPLLYQFQFNVKPDSGYEATLKGTVGKPVYYDDATLMPTECVTAFKNATAGASLDHLHVKVVGANMEMVATTKNGFDSTGQVVATVKLTEPSSGVYFCDINRTHYDTIRIEAGDSIDLLIMMFARATPNTPNPKIPEKQLEIFAAGIGEMCQNVGGDSKDRDHFCFFQI